jgi:type VI secretion system secreted protein VgrG
LRGSSYAAEDPGQRSLRPVPWRPLLSDATGQRLNPRPSAIGAQTAIVVGPEGQTSPSGADEIHTDRQGRIRVRFHWQQGERKDDRSSCWIRVAMALAGNGQGLQFIPRIGHEVLVQFMDGDVDQPVVIGSLYSGQGEAGSRPTTSHATSLNHEQRPVPSTRRR